MSFPNSYKIYLLFFALTFIFYGNSVKNEYNLDDVYVTDNPVVKQGISAIPKIFTSWYYEDQKIKFEYRPITKSSFALEHSIWGSQPHLSHLLNVIFYWICCCLLFRTLILLLGDNYLFFSSTVCLLFLAHPLHTEVVCSLKNREVMFSFIGGILSFIAYLKYASTQKIKYIILGITSFILAYLSKENAIVFLLIIPFSIYYFKKAERPSLFRIIAGHIFQIILLIIIGLIYFQLGEPENTPIEFWENPLFTEGTLLNRLSMGVYSFAYYIKLHFVPYPLILYYGYSYIPFVKWNDLSVIASALLAAITVIFCILNFRKRSLLVYGIAFFVIAISMFINFATPITGIIGERHAFNASAGFCMSIAAVLFNVFGLETNSTPSFSLKLLSVKKWFFISLATIAAFYFAITYTRNAEWKDLYTLCNADVVNAPNSVKIHGLIGLMSLQKYNEPGTSAEEKTRLAQQAIHHYQEAIKIYPKLAVAANNIGLVIAGVNKDYAQAKEYFKYAINVDSAFSEAYYNLAVCDHKLQFMGDAEANYLKAIKLDPEYMKAYFDLTDLYINTGRIDMAIQVNMSGIQKGIKYPDLYLNLGDLYLIKKDSSQAIPCYEQSLAYPPTNKKLLKMLEEYYLRENNREKSILYKKKYEEADALTK